MARTKNIFEEDQAYLLMYTGIEIPVVYESLLSLYNCHKELFSNYEILRHCFNVRKKVEYQKGNVKVLKCSVVKSGEAVEV